MKNTAKKLLALICCLAMCVSAIATTALHAVADGEYFNITEDNRNLFVNVDQDIKLSDISVFLSGADIDAEGVTVPGNTVYWYQSDAEVLIGGGMLTVTAKGTYYVDVEDDDGRYDYVTVIAKNADEDAFELDGESIPAASLPNNPDNYVPTELDPALAVYQSQKIGVMSDIHLQVGATAGEYALKAALTELKAQGVSAVLFTGDLVNTGIAEEYAKFNAIWNEVMGGTDTKMLTITGNHEFEGVYFRGEKYEDLLKTYLNAFGKTQANFHEVVNGIHIIGLNSENHIVDGTYTLKTMSYLEEQLAEAAAADPYAPIIVMCHQTLANTTYGSEWGSSGTGSLYDVLRYYPQVVYLAGHSHFDFTNEKSIMQKNFTCIDVPSMQYTAAEDGNDGSSAVCYDYQNYLILDINGTSKTMEVKRMKSYETESATHAYQSVQVKDSWTLNLPITKKNFTYTANRAEDRVAPTFAAGAAVTVDNVTYNSATVKFPAASHDDYVHAYNVTVTDTAGEILVSKYIVSDFYKLGDKQTEYTVDLDGLFCNTKCVVNVTAVESFGKVSEAISAEFTTAPITDPSAALNRADFMDVNIAAGFADNSPYRRQFNLYVKSHPIKLLVDGELGRQVASMGGWVNYATSLGSLKEITDALSVEVAFKTPANFDPLPKEDGTPGEKEGQTIFGNRENGGFALEFKKEDDTFQASVFIDGEEKILSAGALKANTWYHAVLTFDGNKLVLYLDGAKVGELEAPGAITYDNTISHIAIGGDVSKNGTGARVYTGHVALARIYTEVMDEAAMKAAYSAYKNDNAYNYLYQKYLALQELDTTGMKAEDIAAIDALIAEAEELLNSADLTVEAANACSQKAYDLLQALASYDKQNALILFEDKFDDFTKVWESSAYKGLQWENNTEIKKTLISKQNNEDVYSLIYKLPANVKRIELDALGITVYDKFYINEDIVFFVSKDGKNWTEVKHTATEPTVDALSDYWANSTLSADVSGEYTYVKVQINKFGTAIAETGEVVDRVNWTTVMDGLRIWHEDPGVPAVNNGGDNGGNNGGGNNGGDNNGGGNNANPGDGTKPGIGDDKPGNTDKLGEDMTPVYMAAILMMVSAAVAFITSKKRIYN